jgi:hypothetical protein
MTDHDRYRSTRPLVRPLALPNGVDPETWRTEAGAPPKADPKPVRRRRAPRQRTQGPTAA